MTFYLIQGLLSGLQDSFRLILVNQGAKFSDLGILSFTNYPWAVKIFFAPLLDSYFSSKFGKRKSYFVPLQYLMVIILGFLYFTIDEMLLEMHILVIFIYFLLLQLCAALQDVSVDGMSVTIINEENE
jgi:PAT family acetyl-CoA transporter-like MFS transporter 1